MLSKTLKPDAYLREARVNLGLSLADVAAAMGCSPPAVWDLERRPFARVRASTVQRYQNALAVADRNRMAARSEAGKALIDLGKALVLSGR